MMILGVEDVFGYRRCLVMSCEFKVNLLAMVVIGCWFMFQIDYEVMLAI